jgi:Leucine-rich repeat (LRR) protein
MTSDAVLKIIERAAEEGWHHLKLSDRNLTDIPKEVFKLQNLTRLYLHSNQIRCIPEDIVELINLKRIDLSHNQISEIPDLITQLTKLEVLALHNNQITEIPNTISKLKNLTALYFNENKISEIPGFITQLKKLQEIHFRGNQVVAFSKNFSAKNFSDLNDLKILNLAKNKIKEFPDIIPSLIRLENLNLGFNRLTKIPCEIGRLTALKSLNLVSNQINEIPNELAQLINLEMLFFTDNQIAEIPDFIFRLEKLQILTLSKNKITKIPETIIKLKNLRVLNVNQNQIRQPPPYITDKGIDAISRYYYLNQNTENDFLKIERSIEFPPEYWTAGNSILSYFSHILSIKYPNQNIKVKIEQEGLLLRMIIDTPEGQRELIEQTLNEYGMVIAGKLLPESFLNNPFEVMALENKLETMKLELRQSEKLRALEKEMYSILSDKDRQRIDSLEVKVDQLSDMLEKSLSGDTKPIVNVNVNANDHSSQNSINQHGTRDNIGNDKVGNDKIGRDKIEKE